MTRYSSRPRPLRTAAHSVTRWVGVLGALATGLVGFGVLTAVQGDAVAGLLGAIPGLVTLVTAALSAFGVVRKGEPQVTPVSDPRDTRGVQLLPAGTAR